ncbi:MAG: aminomethyl-transferring glycine dehydrogenase subunit GcvPB [Bacteroidales bacterium]|nr:aminomethyl-transferring glycine dehydrogenase subunit GcvPB [Bacteroidales bacterium]MDY2692323.1 aminomethyl-transferring glycine dehydrogenase subunit GcvPB [Prevotella sp.]MDD5788852.1 aminomethyl-transferring glycine dehydrogenase subunit GcvPB [Bacteroidales bacterium]MDD6897547.1 aminomethyl-transferring glycine dehydrogenase subunit GcvPB [Bacteroidales bacterium]MDY4731263.1 aminomethyl-transferring glycine dehydrogenase subunit GcvPB [Prevotella sp.]
MNNKLYGKLIFELSQPGSKGYSLPKNQFGDYTLPQEMRRTADANLPECDEMTVVRHYTNLSGNNFGVDNGFYPLGSCTMKYNPAINEETAALKAFAALHPLQPAETCQGALAVYYGLQKSLAALTGLSEFTLNPFAGAHGELTGLMIIRAYHESRGDKQRVKVIVPDSAHGTNPASAAVCGLEIVEVKSKKDGRVDVDDLKNLLDDTVAAMMMTNPNTLGLFETEIPEITRLVHECGGLMYYDGANLNPMLGACRPGDMGFDVMHINLHKTFSTPHGGGGPGSGPVGVRAGLEQFLPRPHVVKDGETYRIEKEAGSNTPIHVGAFFGNFGVIIKAYTYILTLGKENIKMVGPLATLNANYIKECLKDVYELPIDGLCKHEFVFDGLKDKSTGITTMDVAKRLLDYGYHAPTIYFPLLFHESMMIEPTESESKETIDGFINVLRTIAQEAIEQPETVHGAPHHTPIGRVDDVLAAKNPILTYKD